MADLRREIGRNIRLLREARRPPRKGRRARRTTRMTIEDLAEATGLSPDYVNKLELGRYQPTAETLVLIADALGVEIGELFPSARAAPGKRQALDELRAFASQFPVETIRYLLRVAQAVMDRPAR
jgi:transcriptional regulator with XRE-family HTH domain